MLSDEVSRLIGDIYESVLSPDLLPRAIGRMHDLLDGGFTMVACADVERNLLPEIQVHARVPNPDAIMREYTGDLLARDPVFAHIRAHPHARFFSGAEHVDPIRDAGYVRWTRDRFGSSDWLLAYTDPAAPLSFGMSLHPRSDDPASERTRAIFRLLFDHFERAARLSIRPPMLCDDREPVIVLDPIGAIVAANAPAAAMIGPAGPLCVVNGELRPTLAGRAERWRSLVRAALASVANGASGGRMVLRHEPVDQAVIATIDPLPIPLGGFPGFRRGALIRLSPVPRAGADSIALAREMFGLTPAEARLARQLLDGEDARRAAEMLGISHATARTQLARLFDKTGVRSQSQLVGLLTRLALAGHRD